MGDNSSTLISLVNVWSDHNRGDAAIVLATLEIIERAKPDAAVHLHNVVLGARDLEQYGEGHFSAFAPKQLPIFPALFPALIVKRGEATYSRLSRLGYAGRALVLLILARMSPCLGAILLNRKEQQAYNSLRRSEVIISKGGSYLLANSWKDAVQLLMVFLPLLLGRIFGKHTMLLGVSVGPARSPFAAWILAQCLRRVDRIIVREEFALNTCRRLGVAENRLTMLPDVALAPNMLNDEHAGLMPPWLQNLQRPLVGVTVRHWSFDDVGDRRRRETAYFDSLATALRQFQDEFHGTLVLIPQVVGPNREGSDLDAIDRLRELLGDRATVAVLPPTLTVDDLRSTYTNLDMLVGTRLHSVLLGFGVPTVIIGYQGDKSIGTARWLGCENQFVHINDITPTSLSDAIEAVWSDRERICANLLERRAAIRDEFLTAIPQILPPTVATREPAPSLPKLRARNKSVRAAIVLIVVFLSVYGYRYLSLHREILHQTSLRNEFVIGTSQGVLRDYYMQPPNSPGDEDRPPHYIDPDGQIVADHPDLLATWALGQFAIWKRSETAAIKASRAREAFFECSRRLQSMLVPRKDNRCRDFLVVEYKFRNPWYPHLKAPWRSGLAQGRVLSVLARHYQERPDPKVLDAITKAVAAYSVPIEQGGIVSIYQGNWFYEEIAAPPPTHILNGHVIALWGLADVMRVVNVPQCQSSYENGVEAVARHIPDFDVFPWSTYDLGAHMWAGTAPPKYQLLHARQMQILYDMTGRDVFLDFAIKWEKELYRPLDQLAYLLCRDYYRATRLLKTWFSADSAG